VDYTKSLNTCAWTASNQPPRKEFLRHRRPEQWWSIDRWMMTGHADCFDKWAQALQWGPIIVPIDAASPEFMFYSDGVYKPNKSSFKCRLPLPDHVVLITGWGVYKGETYFVIKNSWGKNWGQFGYGRVSAEFIMAGALAGDEDIDTSPWFKMSPESWYQSVPFTNPERLCKGKHTNYYRCSDDKPAKTTTTKTTTTKTTKPKTTKTKTTTTTTKK